MPIDYTRHLRADGERMAVAVARDLDAHVPTCPAWNVAKLTIHMGQHHRWVADAIRRGGEPPEDPRKPGLRGDELVEWLRAGWRDLADLLDATDDAAPAWSWSGDDRAGFWRRRTALETLVHRWDAENATGATSPLDAELATDGVDEMLFVMIPSDDASYRGPSLHVTLSATDTGRTWTLGLRDSEPVRPSREGEPVPADAAPLAVTADAADLLLFLWGRRGRDTIGWEGEAAAADAFLRWVEE